MNSMIADGLTPHFLPDWYEALVDSLDFPLAWRPGLEVQSWRETAKRAVLGLLLEPEAPTDATAQVLATEQRDGYRLQVVSLALGRFRRTTALMTIPDGAGPFPAALLLHDHGAFFDIGKEKMTRPVTGHPMAEIAQSWADKNYGGLFVGDEMARRGWVTLSTDALGWGDRTCGGYDNQQAVASNLFNLGSSWAGVIAREDLAAAEYLASLPQVDRRTLVSVGHSMGGYRSYQVAALSDSVTAGVAICCLGTHRGFMVPGGNRTRGQSAFTTTHPGLSRLMDFSDLAGLAAPKPLLFLHGVDDKLFPEAAVRDACGHLADLYSAWRRPTAFAALYRDGGHVFSRDDQARVWDWLAALRS